MPLHSNFSLQFIIFSILLPSLAFAQQPPLVDGLEAPRQRIKNVLGGSYSGNVTLYFRNSPYRVDKELVLASNCTMTIETGVQMYFDTGVGMKVLGTLRAIGNEFAHIQMLPYQEQLNYDSQMPDFRLIDGPTVRQGRLQIRFRDRWRSICTQVTNWTSIDTGAACRSMGYSDGGFWRFYRRNNDTYPFVMAEPKCTPEAKNLWECKGFASPDEIPLSENLCQGEDDLGLYCWGPPVFKGWAKHWKGLQIYHSPFGYVPADPDGVSVQRESNSRLEFLDILFAGYDGLNKNTTAALYIEGVPPLMNGIRVERSARDGIRFFEPDGPILIANSTVAFNRGHGIAVENALDGRLFVNQTHIEGNWGDGIWYKQKHAGLSLAENFLGIGIGGPSTNRSSRHRRQSAFMQPEKPRAEMCMGAHQLPRHLFFPHLIEAHLANGTSVPDPLLQPHLCWLNVALPARLPYAFTIQFIDVSNRHSPNSGARTNFVICEGNSTFPSLCQLERYRLPLRDGILPQSISLNGNGQPILLGIEHIPQSGSSLIAADVNVLFRIHASVNYKAFYGLNITNSALLNNTGNGIQAINIRDRTALHNVSIEGNEGLAGLLVRDGAADIWLNDTSLSWNWGDGVNISYAGGSINLNTSRIVGNRWRGFAFHHNGTIPFWPLRQEVIIKGRPANNVFYPRMLIAGNAWGGLLVGNFCMPSLNDWGGAAIEPKLLVSWTEFADNNYHPHIEAFACQQFGASKMHVDISGNTVIGGTGMGFRMEPCVNAELTMNSNRFHGISNTALLIRNAKHPQLAKMPAKVTIAKNDIKMNTAQFIVSIGLNEDAPHQSLVFNQQNEVRSNTVINPFPFLKPRSTPHAALVVSSSNVVIRHNCFGNPRADFEIGTELMEHAKRIDARQNNWGDPLPQNFMHRIFDQFNRYSLANIEVNPYAAVCNQRAPALTFLQQFFRRFRQLSQPFVIGGTIFENNDLPPGKYTVTDDLHIAPGAKLTLSPGTTMEFMNGIGMLVQGELLRNDLSNPLQPVIFTSRPLGQPPRLEHLRLVDEFGDENALAGRLEIRLEEEGQWGTVCNRSWTAQHAQLACNQLGLTMDPENFENWRIFPPAGDLPIVMDNIRCEEREFDLAKCRHDGPMHNVRASCRPSEVVGLRCAPPYWAGVRYSLLANPPTMTGQNTMTNWVLEKAGLFDFRTSTFSPALQIDWNYHTFHHLTIKDNFFDGLDIFYNDLTRKPAIRNSLIARNRRNGLIVRSMGLSAEKMVVEQNENAGVRYLPRISTSQQKDIVSWLDRQEQPELEANGVFLIPNGQRQRIQVFESQLDQRKFLVAKTTASCPIVPLEPCNFDIDLEAIGHEYGLPPKLVVQLVNRPSNESDEDALLEDRQTNRRWSARNNSIDFPLLASGPRLKLTYRRSFGQPSLILLVLFLDHQEYLDRFVHFYDSVIRDNQYAISAVHHSNLSLSDESAIVNRYADEKLWFQRVNFTRNSDAVVWAHSPEYAVHEGVPLAQIHWHIDNCSLIDNRGPIVDTHRDLFSSANIFHWNFWSNTFANNSGASIFVHLPDTWDLRAEKKHSFWMTENRFEFNQNFAVHLSGYFAVANISSNNFTDNYAPLDLGIVQILGMEKQLVLERNRFFTNWGHWMVRVDISSQSLQPAEVPSFIQNNYIQFNHFLRPSDDYAEMFPRSYAVGIFGLQKVDVHFNRLRNVLMDFELVGGCKPQLAASNGDVLNVTHNWWGVANEAEVGQRIFDLDDWNSLSRAEFSPFYTTDEQFINFWWWDPRRARLSFAPNATDPPAHDLRGRLWGNKKLELDPERWYPFPYHYRPFRPYRITRDLTIMPGATLTIEKNVEVHIWPNVRILVYGNLVADGTLWQPIRFKPINSTEFAEQRGQQGSKYRLKRRTNPWFGIGPKRHRLRHLDAEWRHLAFHRDRQRRASTAAARAGHDDIFRQFPDIRRENPQMQRFLVFLMENGTRREERGFLHFYNATTGEIVPSCDRHFTLRNAQVVCRELGLSGQNAFHWLTPQWDYNPKIRLLKTYMEPRECRGNERRFEQCILRITGLLSDWQCMENEHFNFIHCGPGESLSKEYIGNWGGITFARHSLEQGQNGGEWGAEGGDGSVLRHVEVVGGGRVHNDSLFGAALQVIQRSPLLENVNVTNSSLNALQIIFPSSNVVLSRMNISDNHGIGLTILSANLQSSASSPSFGANSLPRGPLNIPYQMPGLLDICSSGKEVPIKGRVLFFFKYDSFAVDCVKVFRSVHGQNLAFRFLQANFFHGTIGVPRQDGLSVYVGNSFALPSLLRTFNSKSNFERGGTLSTQSQIISFHLRATAADGEFGFIAEVASLPIAPSASRSVDEMAIRISRLLNNDRGAIQYGNLGEVAPKLIVEQCAIDRNGYHLFGNISTSMQAVEMHLHNTMLLLFRANSLRHNRGGLLISANSASAAAQLNAIIKNNAFAFNSNSTTLALFGNGLQRAILMNNLIIQNYALYADTAIVNGISSNFSHNLIDRNVGWHTIDTGMGGGGNGMEAAQMHFLHNFFEANLALGHGNPYVEKYGFHDGHEADEFTSRRPKRQVLNQRGISFDWWTHVRLETSRFRSTVLSGSVHQKFGRNVFNDPQNDFELTTGPLDDPQFSPVAIDARHNYWGPPGSSGVAAGKIRDQKDNPLLIRVEFEPVLESNTSLIEGDCPAGWFQIGHEEFKSCFLFVGASSTYADAVQFCQQLDAFMPILRNSDPRQDELANRIDGFGQQFVTDVERENSFGIAYDIPIWIASVKIPSNQCGWMSSRTASIGEQNCHNLLPFVCEKGTKPYQEPILWRYDFVFVIFLVLSLIFGIILLTFCAWRKAQRKDDNFPLKRELVRDSIRRNKELVGGGQIGKDFVPLSAFGQTNGSGKGAASPSQSSSSEYYGGPSCCRSADSLFSTDTVVTSTIYAKLNNKNIVSSSINMNPAGPQPNNPSGSMGCSCYSPLWPKANCPNCSFSAGQSSNETSYSTQSTESSESTSNASSDVSASSNSTLVPHSGANQPLLGQSRPSINGGPMNFGSNSTLKQCAQSNALTNAYSSPNIAPFHQNMPSTSSQFHFDAEMPLPKNRNIQAKHRNNLASPSAQRRVLGSQSTLRYEPIIMDDPPDPRPTKSTIEQQGGYVNLRHEHISNSLPIPKTRPIVAPPKIPTFSTNQQSRKRQSMEGISALETSM